MSFAHVQPSLSDNLSAIIMPRRLAVLTLNLVCVSAGLCLSSAVAYAQNASKDSPFLPPSSAAPAGQAASAGYALTGMTVVGKDTLLSVTNQSDKRSTWVAVGKTVGDITAISYDAAEEKAVIRAGGQNYTLVLKKGAVLPGPAVSFSPPVSQAPAAAPPPTPAAVEVPQGNLSAQEEKEMEARMLVTDLLEIGQQQRKAYAEAQRQAAAKGANQPPAAQPAPPPASSTKKQ